MNQQQQLDAFGAVLERSGSDAAFRQQLLADPRGVLQAQGLQLPSELEIVALENSDKLLNLVIPQPPAVEGELSDEQLEDVAGGFGLGIALTILAASFIVGGAAVGGASVGIGFGAGKAMLRRK
jgi:hypothetical protein